MNSLVRSALDLFAVPMEERIIEGRPVLDQRQVTRLSEQIMSMTSAETVEIGITHMATAATNIASSRVRSCNDGDVLKISLSTRYGQRGTVWTITNQIDEGTLRAIVQRCESLARDQVVLGTPAPEGSQQQDTYPSINIWHNTTVQSMNSARESVVPALVEGVTKHGLKASGFVGQMARTRAILTKDGVTAFGEETDTEITLTARTPDYKASGWAGQAHRDWSKIDYAKVAEDASQMALRSRNSYAVEPGRRTAILGPAAVVQMLRYFAQQFDAGDSDSGRTALSKANGRGNKIGQRIFDPRIQMTSNPADPDGGYMGFFGMGYNNPGMVWVENGILKNLAYDPRYGVSKNKPYAGQPYSFRLTSSGDTTNTIDEMIASCEEGIYVNRLSDVNMLKLKTGMMTGVTSGGCFLIKNGKIDRGVKNFRILDSPFFFLNTVSMIGKPERAAFGYTPPTSDEPTWSDTFDWPRQPVIVPPIMVKDFNFAALADAV